MFDENEEQELVANEPEGEELVNSEGDQVEITEDAELAEELTPEEEAIMDAEKEKKRHDNALAEGQELAKIKAKEAKEAEEAEKNKVHQTTRVVAEEDKPKDVVEKINPYQSRKAIQLAKVRQQKNLALKNKGL